MAPPREKPSVLALWVLVFSLGSSSSTCPWLCGSTPQEKPKENPSPNPAPLEEELVEDDAEPFEGPSEMQETLLTTDFWTELEKQPEDEDVKEKWDPVKGVLRIVGAGPDATRRIEAEKYPTLKTLILAPEVPQSFQGSATGRGGVGTRGTVMITGKFHHRVRVVEARYRQKPGDDQRVPWLKVLQTHNHRGRRIPDPKEIGPNGLILEGKFALLEMLDMNPGNTVKLKGEFPKLRTIKATYTKDFLLDGSAKLKEAPTKEGGLVFYGAEDFQIHLKSGAFPTGPWYLNGDERGTFSGTARKNLPDLPEDIPVQESYKGQFTDGFPWAAERRLVTE